MLFGRLQGLAEHVFGEESKSGVGARLARGTASTVGLKVAYLGMSFVLSLILARWLGTAGYGAYAYAMAWAVFLTVPACLGLDNLLMRDVAAFEARSEWGLMRGLMRQANLLVLAISAGVALLAGVVSWVFLRRADPEMLSAFRVALLLVPILGLTRLMQASLQGLHRVGLGQLPGMLIHPLLLIFFLAGAHVILAGKLGAALSMGLNVAAASVALLAGVWFLGQKFPEEAKLARPAYRRLAWLDTILPLVFLSSMGTIYAQTDTLLLGAIKGAKAVGIYGIADRGAELVAFSLMALSPALGPTISSLYAKRDIKQLQSVATKSAQLTLLASTPLALAFILFGHWFLLHFFGPEFTRGQKALAILSVGQLVSVGMGSVGYLLIMTGHEGEAAKGIAISALVNVVLNGALIPVWGLEGAAVATATSTVVWNVLLAVKVRRKLGIHPTALGRFGL